MVDPFTPSAVTGDGGKPELTDFQLVPLFVERTTPKPSIAAKRFEPLTAKD
jgi:hypothetical protein